LAKAAEENVKVAVYGVPPPEFGFKYNPLDELAVTWEFTPAWVKASPPVPVTARVRLEFPLVP
jgi:hypothetical protein